MRRGILYLLVLLAPYPAAAQHRFADDELPLVQRMLEAEIGDAQHAQQAMAVEGQRYSEVTTHIAGVQSGQVDALTWLRTQSSHVAIPPEATYSAACSQMMGTGAVVLTLNVALPVEALEDMAEEYRQLEQEGAERHAPRSDQEYSERQRRYWDNLVQTTQIVRDSEAGAAQRRAVHFYEQHGFRHFNGNIWATRDHTEDPEGLTAVFFEYNPWPTLPGCDALPMGPVVVLSLHELKANRDARAEAAERPTSPLEQFLAREGMDRQAYEALSSALFFARTDAEDPSMLALMEKVIEKPEEKAYLAERQHNLAWYRRHEAELAPWLRRLDEVVGR